MLHTALSADTEVAAILDAETRRQKCSIELIASENYTSRAVLEANGTIFTNKYSEGYPGRRYYGGNEHIDALELLCKKRALAAFGLDSGVWDVNVQAYSGSTANFAVYTALLAPGDRLMGLDLPSGGHLTHGYYTSLKKISASSIYFQSLPYSVGADGHIDYDSLERDAGKFKPRLLIGGASAYCRDFDWPRFRAIADASKAYLMADIAHTAGLVSAGLLTSPFSVCDVVTTTTHKTLRGPRGALIFYRRALKDLIDFAVFPSCQGGPHNNTIAAIAVALGQVATPEYRAYAAAVQKNAAVLCTALQARRFRILTDGTENHLLLVDVRAAGTTGARYERIAELCSISVNKNTIPSDTSALNPSGIRIGTPAMTSRGFGPAEFEFVADCLLEVLGIAKGIEGKTLADFTAAAATEPHASAIAALRAKVEAFSEKFPLPVAEFS